ncbi:MAG TPA: hypothetical protein VM686_29680 [Polyangiaceae bacterium]|nr:hypothetical protein [Polyangiaceae bacterium]
MKRFLLCLSLLLAAPHAHAFGRETTSTVRGEVNADHVSSGNDGVYGRFDGDLDLGFGAGGRFDGSSERFSLGTRLSAHYFSLAGVYLEYADAFGQSDTAARSLGFGVDVRPLFVPRWSQDMQGGSAFGNLTLDSISLALGAYYAQPEDMDFGDERGFSASLGIAFPLALYATGPWLELRGGLELPDRGDTRGTVLALLSFHYVAVTPLSPESERVR